MSVISDRHNVNPFVAGKSEALAGQRLAKVGYKSTKKNPAKFKSVCVSVPMIPDQSAEDIGKFQSIIRTALENAQDGIIRSLYESSQGALTSVADSEISVNACLAFIDAEASGGKMTAEFLTAWFAENVAENVAVAVAEKHSLELDDAKVVNTVNAMRDMIADFSGKPRYNPEQIAFIRRGLELASEEDDVCKRLNARLDAMEKKPDMSALLGF